MKRLLWLLLLLPTLALAADIDIDTPQIQAVRQSMQARFPSLQPWLASGAVGLTSDGLVALRDPAAVPMAERATVNRLIGAENADRQSLYKAIAAANGHPEWAADIQRTFAQRWMDRASPGWWIQSAGGWTRK